MEEVNVNANFTPTGQTIAYARQWEEEEAALGAL
jgi:hypothetical protein